MQSTIIQPYTNLRTVCLGIVTHYGAAYDSLAGSAKVLLQTMVRGTEQYNETDIARLIDGTGGSLFSTAEKDFSIIGAQVQPKYAVRTLDLLFEMINHPTLDESHVSIEKGNLIQTFNQVNANPLKKMLIFDADKAVFGENHPFGRSQIGTPESLDKITRNDLQTVHQNLLVNPWGFAVGAISKSLHKEIEQKFSKFLKTKEKKTISVPKRSVLPNHLIVSPDIENGNVYLCSNIVTDINPDIIGLSKFSSALLGESFSSRMFSILRDQKALGYIVGAALKLLGDKIIIRCFMETSPKRTEEAINSLLELLTDLGKKEISKEEYNTTRDFILGNLDLSFDDSRVTASSIINRGVHGLSPYIESGYEEIQSVISKDLHSWWKNALLHAENFSLALAGNIDPNEIQQNWENNTYRLN